jgi:hypothetical protein
VSYSIIDQAGFSGVNNNINSDPLFINPSAGNFHLQPGSPARGAGTSTGAPLIDIECQLRFPPPSIGAYEFVGPGVGVRPAAPAPAQGSRPSIELPSCAPFPQWPPVIPMAPISAESRRR